LTIPLPVRGATGCPPSLPLLCLQISIHAPRAGSDDRRADFRQTLADFNPRSPCGERRADGRAEIHGTDISIHAPRAGSDRREARSRTSQANFNPRSPCGERRCADREPCALARISIHAPRAGSDASRQYSSSSSRAFQSTLPVRGATRDVMKYAVFIPFQSTLPVRGATRPARSLVSRSRISIHAPRAGSDH